MFNQLAILWHKFKKFKLFLGPKVWLYFIITVFFGICWFFVDLSFIYVIQIFLISLGLFEQNKTLISNFLNFTPINGVIFLCLFGFLRSILSGARYYVTGILAQEFALKNRSRIMEVALTKENYQESSAETLSLYGERIGSACNIVTNVGQLIITCMAICLYFGMGLFFSPTIFLIGVVFFILFVLPLKLIDSKIENSGKGVSETATKAYYILLLGIKNKFYLRLTDMIETELRKGLEKLQLTYKFYLTYYRYSSLKNCTPMFVGTVVIGFLTFIGVTYIHTPAIQLLSIFYVFLRLGQMIADSNAFLSEIRLHYPSFLLLVNFLDQNKETFTKKTSTARHEFNDLFKIEMQDVSFGYNSEKKIIDGLSFVVKKGDILLIKGPSGVGKSTVLALTAGILSPFNGRVLINDLSLENIKTNLPDLIGYVGPDPFIIPGTIRENLFYGNPKLHKTDDEIWEVLDLAECSAFVQHLEGSIEHYLSELTPLSTGQKQRLALARALLRNPKLYIFDEATANLDQSTESKIKDLIKRVSTESITFIISHKDTFDDISTTSLFLTQGQHSLEPGGNLLTNSRA